MRQFGQINKKHYTVPIEYQIIFCKKFHVLPDHFLFCLF
jgi:hypothetical protein